MVKIKYENPFEELEFLVQVRKVLSARADQLEMLVERDSLKRDQPMSMEIENRGLVFRSTHKGIITKALAYMLAEYRKRLTAIEREIKELSEKIIEYNHDNTNNRNQKTTD
ncbi:MAG: hypothetical protein F9K23_17400 [Bacteroidetes bacterium]|nr:MAG: hypothetical protein F9K23_17400 [Bacteroidota bacterium]